MDHWTGQTNKVQVASSDDLDDAIGILKRLDGRAHTQLTLVEPEGAMVTIGGGPDRFLIQYLLAEDGGEWSAAGNPSPQDDVELSIWRQDALCPNRQLANINQAIATIAAFLIDGSRSRLVGWERSG